MSHSLYYKFTLRYLTFDLLGFTAITTASSKITYNHLMEKKTEVPYDEANLIAPNYSTVYQGKPIDTASAYPQLEAVAVFTQMEIWVVGCKGTIVMDSNHPDRVGTTIQDFDPTPTGSKSYCVGSYYDCFPGEVLSVPAPITNSHNTYGYVITHLPFSQITATQNGILNVLYISTGIIFTLSLTILLVLTQTVYIPSKKITAATSQYAEGSLKHKTELHTRNKIGYLAVALNCMSDGLDQMEEYQHTFIANTSHDFRSPLTSIKGYLEAILDDAIPPEVYEKCLTRVITGTERLNKLTQGMLTPDSLDSRDYLPRTSLDTNWAIKDAAVSFEGTYENKNTILDLALSNSTQMVYADMGKIQQVLYNLIDNAIEFSHHGFTIYIRTSIKNEKVLVFAKNMGIDIPKPSQRKIWERFYKSDLFRGKDKKGTGLGLATVEEIIQSYGESIDCISTKGVGTGLIFSLPRSINL